MNDLPDVIKSSNIESYFDDTKIYLSFSANDVDSCLRLVAEDLRRVEEWCCENHLLVKSAQWSRYSKKPFLRHCDAGWDVRHLR